MNSLETSWQFYLCAENAWDGMYEACENAKKEIKFEQFIFQNNFQGERFAEMLIRKAREGISVSLLVDCGGSYSFYNSALAKEMSEAGIHLVFFNRISPWRLSNLRLWFFRDHRKILCVDGEVAFLGGVGIDESMRGWRDTHLKITGDVVLEIEATFDRMMGNAKSEKFLPFNEPRQLLSGFSLLTNAPHRRQRFVYRRFISAIRNAEKYIYITTPYFVPDTRLFRVLRLAARRGVDVRILLPFSSDHPYVDWASHFHFRKALKSGIKIWNYRKMLHSKSMVIDDAWASIGSSNMDNYSFFFNYEANLVSLNKKFAEEVRGHFESDLLKSDILTFDVWQRRPFHQKVLEIVSTFFAKFF